MENLDQTYKRLLSENKKEETCKGCGEKMSKCSCNTVEEELKGGQKNLDKNHNGKLDGQDFAILRNKKKKVVSETAEEPPFDKPYKTTKGVVTDKSGAKHGPMSRARDLARSALNKHLNATYDEYNPEKDKLKKQHFGMAEEVEQIDELSKDTLKSYKDEAEYHKDRLKGHIEKTKDWIQQSKSMVKLHPSDSIGAAHKGHIKSNKTELSTAQKLLQKRRAGIDKAGERLAKEEVQIDEANHRDYACSSCMHPTMAKHMTVGQHTDYYEPKTGNKIHGKVMHKSDTEVHLKQTHDSYDDKKVGSVHKFKIKNSLDEVLKASMGAGAYIDDFVHSKNPKFAGKSKEMRKKMALAAYYAAKKGMKEEVELDEGKGDTKTYQYHMDKHHEYAAKGDFAMAAHHAKKAELYGDRHLQAVSESTQNVTPTVKTNKYSWGTMKTIHHGSSFSIPLHPEHHEHIAQMKDQQQHTIKTEDGRQYHVKREGDTVHFHGVNGGNKTSVPHKSLAEETQVDEAWVLRQKKKEKKPVKEDTVKSFKDFITEMEFDKNGKYVHKGKYGTSYDDPEGKEDNEKPAAEKAEKRGRGRPAGAKSGARQIGGASKKGSGVEYTGYKLHLPNSNK